LPVRISIVAAIVVKPKPLNSTISRLLGVCSMPSACAIVCVSLSGR